MGKQNPLYWPRGNAKGTEQTIKEAAKAERNVAALQYDATGDEPVLGASLNDLVEQVYPAEETTKTDEAVVESEDKGQKLLNLIEEVYSSWAKTKK